MEHALDQWVTLIYHKVGGSDVERKLPRQLSHKIIFEPLFDDIPRIAPFSVACVQSFAKIVALTNTRHFLVHGVVTGYDSETGTLKFTKPELIEDKTLQMMNELKITGHQLAQQSIEWENLAISMMEITKRLLSAFVTKKKP